MKFPTLFCSLVSSAMLGLLLPAQAAETKTLAKPEAKAVSKTPAAATKKTPAPKKKTSSKKKAAKPAATVPPAATFPETTLSTPLQTNIAKVEVGHMPCELGQSVTVAADPLVAGNYDLQFKGINYQMQLVPTSTGAIRLEDKIHGTVWIQLGNKSMLMNQKLGQRLTDECQSPQQARNAQAMQMAPSVSLLDSAPQPAQMDPRK